MQESESFKDQLIELLSSKNTFYFILVVCFFFLLYFRIYIRTKNTSLSYSIGNLKSQIIKNETRHAKLKYELEYMLSPVSENSVIQNNLNLIPLPPQRIRRIDLNRRDGSK